MRKLASLFLALTLTALTACSNAPADSALAADSSSVSSAAKTPAPAEEAPADSTVETSAEPATEAAQRNVLDGFVDFAADTAGGSLKTARAAAALVEYLSYADIDTAVASDWKNGLTQDQQQLLELNWSGILANAQDIVNDPASQADLLSSAGVTTRFEEMTLTEVPDKLVSLNTVLTGKAG